MLRTHKVRLMGWFGSSMSLGFGLDCCCPGLLLLPWLLLLLPTAFILWRRPSRWTTLAVTWIPVKYPRMSNHDSSLVLSSSPAFLSLLLFRSAPPPRQCGDRWRRGHHRAPFSSSSALSLAMQGFLIWGFRFLTAASPASGRPLPTPLALCLARNGSIRVRISWVRVSGVKEAERREGVGKTGRWNEEMGGSRVM